jgi:acyl-homoserine-lactone acylase
MIGPADARLGETASTGAAEGKLAATIRTTEYGIPHILADDYADLGFGTGYAAARDNMCQVVKTAIVTSGQSSRSFGPNGRPESMLIRAGSNLVSDMYFTGVNDSGVVERLMRQPAPRGPSRELRDLIRGYAAGFNKLMAEGHATSCTGATWLRPITELDIHRAMYAVTQVFGQGSTVEGIVAARPPTGSAPAAGQEPANATSVQAPSTGVRSTGAPPPASNALALGGSATANGRGMVLANPHFVWQGDLKVWQVHQTIPGRLNVNGATFLGMPVVAFGHNGSLAWSGTATDATTKFALFELRLVPGKPTTYLVDGRPERMTRRDVTIQVRRDDGKIEQRTGSQWRTRYGPVMTRLDAATELPWTAERAYALADPNTQNLRLGDALLRLNRAGRTGEVVEAARRVQGLPWINITAADAAGSTVYTGPQVVPNVTDQHAERCNTALGRRLFDTRGLPVLDGSREECGLGRGAGAVQPGILGPDQIPVLSRRDYVTNSNSSHWLTNPRRLLEGLPRVVGAERVEPTPRTRTGHLAVAEQLATGRFTPGDLQGLVLSNRALAGELTRDETVAMCRRLAARGGAPGASGPVDVSAACDVLARWDLRMDTTSRGALLFDRFWRAVWPTRQQTDVWRVPFDAGHPTTTPRGLDTANPRVQRAFGAAVAELNGHGIALDAPLGDYQYTVRGGRRIPISGGTNSLGVYNATEAIWNERTGGYDNIPFGPTVLQVTSFDGDACPDFRTVLAYSQSGDPTSPHHLDQTLLFSKKEWIKGRFCEAEIKASPELEVLTVRQD